MKIAQNRGNVKWGKRQSQAMRNAVFSPSLKAISYPSTAKNNAPSKSHYQSSLVYVSMGSGIDII